MVIKVGMANLLVNTEELQAGFQPRDRALRWQANHRDRLIIQNSEMNTAAAIGRSSARSGDIYVTNYSSRHPESPSDF